MIYLDSALIQEAQQAMQFGWVKGITTNPTLLAKSPLAPEETLFALRSITSGELYYQLVSTEFEDMISEGYRAYEIIGSQIVLKIPATPVGFKVVARLAREIPCSVTAIYSAHQSAVAAEAGAKYAIVYVDRAARLLGDGLALVRQMSNILQASNTQILAASLKSPQQAADALQSGADHLTLPLNILQSMGEHSLSQATVEEFNQNGIGISHV